jgi:hypothetical protein
VKIRYLVAAFLMIVMLACEYEDSDINYNMGNDFLNDPTTVIKIDTITVLSYTTTIDSFITSRGKRLLIGNVEHSYGGNTYCESYFRFDPCEIVEFDETSQYDSIRLIFHLDGYNAGDTTSTGEFEVYRLTEDIELDEDDDYIYNTTQFAAEETPMGTFSINWDDWDDEHDSVFVTLSDVLGEELYRMIDEESDTIDDEEDFKEFFKGVVIRPVDGQAGFIAGFQANIDSTNSPRIRLYYHDRSLTDDLHLDFPLEEYYEGVTGSSITNAYSFIYIENNFDDSSLSDMVIDEEEKFSSTLSGNMSFIQSGLVLSTRFEFPYLENLNALGIGSIVTAELQIEPITGTYDESEDLIQVLSMSLVEDDNEYYQPLYSPGTTTSVYGYLNYSSKFASETYYSYDVTNFIKTEYEDEGMPTYTLLMSSIYDYDYPDVDRLVIGDNQYSGNELKLVVYLTLFN